jgi:hypothetical protein
MKQKDRPDIIRTAFLFIPIAIARQKAMTNIICNIGHCCNHNYGDNNHLFVRAQRMNLNLLLQ